MPACCIIFPKPYLSYTYIFINNKFKFLIIYLYTRMYIGSCVYFFNLYNTLA